MKLSIICEDLINLLKQINNITLNNVNSNILKNIIIKINNNEIILTGTNLYSEIIVFKKLDNLNIYDEISIPFKKIFDICKSIDKKSLINFIKKDDYLIINIKKSYFSFLLNNVNKLPNLVKKEKKIEIYISAISLKNAIKQVNYSMGVQDVRRYLNGISFELYKNELKCVSTDGHRLSLCKIILNSNIEKKYSFIVPRQGINEILKLLDNNIDKVFKLSICNKNIYLDLNDTFFSSVLLDEQFPEFEFIFLKKLDYNIKINRKILKEALSRISIISNEKIFFVKLIFLKNNLIISTFNANQEKSKEYIKIDDIINNKIEITINGYYIIETLSILKNENIILNISNEKSFIYIEENNSYYSKHIIMPICI